MRHVNRGVLLALAVLSGLHVASCAEPQQPDLEVTPPEAELVAGQTVQLVVTRRFLGGPFETVTDRARYMSSNRSVAAVSERGLVTAGTEQGTAQIRVLDGSSDATASVRVVVRAP